jgi:hypothetical protein
MKRHWVIKAVKVMAFVVVFIAVFSGIVMMLWNWLMPTLFGWQQISYWQAAAILILSKILFGGLRGRGGPPWHWRRRMLERWEQMTPEEREKFRQGFQSRS